MNIQDARRSLAKWLNEEPNAPVDRTALATMLAEYDRIAAIREGLGKAQEPVARLMHPSDKWKETLHTPPVGARTYAEYPASEMVGNEYWREGAPLYTAPPADSAHVLVDALEKGIEFWSNYSAINESAQDDMADEKDAMLEQMRAALAAHKSEVKG